MKKKFKLKISTYFLELLDFGKKHPNLILLRANFLPIFDAERQEIIIFLCTMASRPQNHSIFRARFEPQIQVDLIADNASHGLRVAVVKIAVLTVETGALMMKDRRRSLNIAIFHDLIHFVNQNLIYNGVVFGPVSHCMFCSVPFQLSCTYHVVPGVLDVLIVSVVVKTGTQNQIR